MKSPRDFLCRDPHLPSQTTLQGSLSSSQSTHWYSQFHDHDVYDDKYVGSSSDVQSQIDLLARLRIIEQLQGFCLPRFRNSVPDDILTDILNWMCLCFCPNPSSDDVSIALALYSGQITVYIGSTPNSPSLSSLQTTKNIFKSTLKRVILSGVSSAYPTSTTTTPPVATAVILLRMVVNIGWKRIQRKISLLGNTDGDPEQTGSRFVSLVRSWLFYRPEGERSKAFADKALSDCGDIARTTDYMVQSFWIVLDQADMCTDDMGDEQRFQYLTSIMRACDMFIQSTFFDDLLNHHTFRITLKQADLIFLHTLLRRFSHIASYHSGAVKFAIIGVPFIHEVLGESGIKAFLEDRPKGGIVFELISEYQGHQSPRHTSRSESERPSPPNGQGNHSRKLPASPTPATALPSRNIRSYTWQESPSELLPSILGLCDNDGSRGAGTSKRSSRSGFGGKSRATSGDDDDDEEDYNGNYGPRSTQPHSREGSTDTDNSSGTCESSDYTASTTSTTSTEDESGSKSGPSAERNHHYHHRTRNTYRELRRLDRKLQLELLSSDVISEAWVPGNTVTVKCHSVLQLIHHLDSPGWGGGGGVDVLAQTVGTSKPVCWMCGKYIKCLEAWYLLTEDEDEDEDGDTGDLGEGEDVNAKLMNNKPAAAPRWKREREEKIPKKWYLSKPSGKVRHDWLIPLEAPPEVVDAVIEDAQKEMERVVEEVAFDRYL
ncbi:hypothetical protein E1B28_005467 [Marasmius oreades]|uniref:Uncharacterized protein n=1 Tax=Marasmius oreades TaxID=181124 RepID=A0A9P7S3R7_9AGAR|nr:uncharacterized protein E1B28_005467 [Marasmius oreades]KAG7094643.1 hypothetical protein E1B28_005467 [Marasmius oreades]